MDFSSLLGGGGGGGGGMGSTSSPSGGTFSPTIGGIGALGGPNPWMIVVGAVVLIVALVLVLKK